MNPVTNAISSIGATPYVDAYSAIELVGNIQVTAILVFGLLGLSSRFVGIAGIKLRERTEMIGGLLIILSVVVFAVSTFVRIWL